MHHHLLRACAFAALVGCTSADPATEIPDAATADAIISCEPMPRIIYVNPAGGEYTPGSPPDAAQNVTSIITEDTVFEAFAYPLQWDEIMACARADVAAYDIVLTDVDPAGEGTPHQEVVVTESDSTVALGEAGIPSIAPYSCDLIEGAVAFVFAGVYAQGGSYNQVICNQIGWTVAKLMTLDNTVGCDDLNGRGCTPAQDPGFVDVDLPCGESAQRNCFCGEPSGQNSHQRLLELVGPSCE